MEGESREGTRVVEVTFNARLLQELDALLPPKQRSKTIERWARAFVMKRRYGPELPMAIQDVLALID